MNKLLVAAGLLIAAAAPLQAMARTDVSVNLGFGLPAPVYVEPAPVYYAPPPPPRHYYYSPRPVVVYQPAYQSRRVVYRDRHYYHDHGKKHRHDDRYDDDRYDYRYSEREWRRQR